MPILLLIFIVVPLAEIAVFVQVGGMIGVSLTIGLVIVTALIGTAMLRYQGYNVLARTQTSLQNGELPVDSVIDGVFLLVAGALLLTPGLITDAFGFLLFAPPVRRAIGKAIISKMIEKGRFNMHVYSQDETFGGAQRPQNDNSQVIDVDYSDVQDESQMQDGEDLKVNKPNPCSPWNPKR